MFAFRAVASISIRKAGKYLIGFSAFGIGASFTIGTVAAYERKLDWSSFMAKPLTAIEELEMNSESMRTRMELMILGIQTEVCKKISAIDGQKFRIDRWERKEGGGGISCVIQDGELPANCYLLVVWFVYPYQDDSDWGAMWCVCVCV